MRLCSVSASSVSPAGRGKKAGSDIQQWDERNKCGISHSFHGIWHLFHYSTLWLKQSVVKTNIEALREPAPSCSGVLGGTLSACCTGSRKEMAAVGSLIWEVMFLSVTIKRNLCKPEDTGSLPTIPPLAEEAVWKWSLSATWQLPVELCKPYSPLACRYCSRPLLWVRHWPVPKVFCLMLLWTNLTMWQNWVENCMLA